MLLHRPDVSVIGRLVTVQPTVARNATISGQALVRKVQTKQTGRMPVERIVSAQFAKLP